MGDSQKISSLVTGGAASAGPPLGPALGPLGVNIMEIINAINEKTKDFDKKFEELHDIVNKIGKINGIYNTETFIDLQKTEKNPTFS